MANSWGGEDEFNAVLLHLIHSHPSSSHCSLLYGDTEQNLYSFLFIHSLIDRGRTTHLQILRLNWYNNNVHLQLDSK